MNAHETIKNTIRHFLGKLSIEPDSIDVKEHKLHPIFSVRTEKDSALLIGNRGESLQALNYLIKKALEKDADIGEMKFLIDVNGYQERKLEELEKKAHALADRARMFKHEVEMEPMNAYERMVVHALFADNPSIETMSAGEGKFRRITIRYKENGERSEEA
ncbi:hypothetical protein HYW58_01085 [Candidatus Kaiserbacteria bacterium]|nr:hypothetical protein [Candidatus Kaiserbacteria bacterium]